MKIRGLEDISVLENLVPEEGLEPSRDCSHGILSPARLPVSPLRQIESMNFYRKPLKVRDLEAFEVEFYYGA